MDLPTVDLLGLPVAAVDEGRALDALVALHDAPAPALACFVNAHTVNLAARDPRYRALLAAADLVLNDGSGVALAARMRGRRFPANLNGTDLSPALLRRAAALGWPVFFVGGAPGVAAAAAAGLCERIPGLQVVGAAHGYLTPERTDAVVSAIRASGASLLLVGMGNPLQEQWLARHLSASGARLGLGVGAFFDFSAGRVPRAPAWVNRCGVEWVYRLRNEPSRLWRRYLLGNPAFLLRAARDAPADVRAMAARSDRNPDRTNG